MQTKSDFKYPDWAKMPKNYDFSTKKKDWSLFQKDFLLRTDAVWEKYKLLDFFRHYNNLFKWNEDDQKFYKIELNHPTEIIYFNENLESPKIEHTGFTESGCTNEFEQTQGTFNDVQVSSQTNYLKQDMFELCAYRFNKWYECDFVYNQKAADFAAKQQEYPCQKLYWETEYSCSDHMIEFLFELSHYRLSKGIDPRLRQNIDLMEQPNYLDSPSANGRHKYTY